MQAFPGHLGLKKLCLRDVEDEARYEIRESGNWSRGSLGFSRMATLMQLGIVSYSISELHTVHQICNNKFKAFGVNLQNRIYKHLSSTQAASSTLIHLNYPALTSPLLIFRYNSLQKVRVSHIGRKQLIALLTNTQRKLITTHAVKKPLLNT